MDLLTELREQVNAWVKELGLERVESLFPPSPGRAGQRASSPERKTPTTPSKAEAKVKKDQRIRLLEEKIVAQRAHITRLEECRQFERETEKRLATALVEIYDAVQDSSTLDVTDEEKVQRVSELAGRELATYVTRMGPRQEQR